MMGRLFWKIFLGFWLTLVVITAGVGVAVHLHNQSRFEAFSEFAAGPRASFAVSATAAALSHGGKEAVLSLFADWPGPRRPAVLIVNESGEDLFDRTVPPAALERARSELGQAVRVPGLRRVISPSNQEYILFVPIEMRKRGGPHQHMAEQSTLELRLAVAVLASLLFSAGLAWYLTRPVRHLQRAAGALSRGRLDTRVMPLIGKRRDEIADLGRDFDHMAEQLQVLVTAQRRLLHDVSHELRSPLARLQVALGLARQQPGKIPDVLNRIEREGERLDELVGQLLTLARLESGVSEEAKTDVDMRELLNEVADDAHFEAEAHGREVKLDIQDEAVIQGRAELLRRAFENIVRNAVEHTAEGTAVEIQAYHDKAEQAYVVSICDQGPGIDEAQWERIFEPFIRVGEEATGGRGGYGLGLAIVKRAVEAHGGEVSAGNSASGSLCIAVYLPLDSTAMQQVS